ncbi:hypothetical protein NtB2_01183 [Lactococcus termiticola]|uniref:DUF4352 domain-containing protein n=2 Tax=Lactococcus termiticola TaxID=2169526 RepID=A0A2R5HGQ6_9LACT|nr:hypothetical protein NtB2_01183 [Lactococcus termiticola]
MIGLTILASLSLMTACGKHKAEVKPATSTSTSSQVTEEVKISYGAATPIFSDDKQAKENQEFIAVEVTVQNPKKDGLKAISASDFSLKDKAGNKLAVTDLKSKDGKSYQTLTKQNLKSGQLYQAYLTFEVNTKESYDLVYDKNEAGKLDMSGLAKGQDQALQVANDYVAAAFLGADTTNANFKKAEEAFTKAGTDYYKSLKLFNGTAKDITMTKEEAATAVKGMMVANKAKAKTDYQLKVLYPTFMQVELKPSTIHFTDISFDKTQQDWVDGQPDSSFDPDNSGNLVLKADKQAELNAYTFGQIPKLLGELKAKKSTGATLSLSKTVGADWALAGSEVNNADYKNLEQAYYYGR